MEAELLPCVEIAPSGGRAATRAVIWLHGLGADGHDFEPIVPELGLDDLAVRFVFPHAPRIPVTINGGMVMPAWYDITDLDLRRRADLDGVRRSDEHVRALIRRENERGVPTEHIVLAGFSQGGAIALHAGLRHAETLAGIVALSTYLIEPETLEADRADANLRTPVLQAHGTQDPMVPAAAGRAAHERLVALGYDATWHDYPMMHQVCLEEIQEVAAFLRARLG